MAIDESAGEQAAVLRQTRRIELPDATIRATALNESALLVTRNTKAFPSEEPGIGVAYGV